MTLKIKIEGPSGQFGYLSIFYPSEFQDTDSRTYCSVAHYILIQQALECDNTRAVLELEQTTNAMSMIRIISKLDCKWDKLEQWMWQGNLHKFAFQSSLFDQLCTTRADFVFVTSRYSWSTQYLAGILHMLRYGQFVQQFKQQFTTRHQNIQFATRHQNMQFPIPLSVYNRHAA
jgi:predicted NAD-dependent protein-ADP-ribosyltransferase YbiA (DUF1768 family)